MGVCGFRWPSSLDFLYMGTAVLGFKNNSPCYASAADDITDNWIGAWVASC